LTSVDAFTIVAVWFGSAFSGAWAALAIAQAITGRRLFPLFSTPKDWTARELKLSGWSWAVCGLVGMATVLFGGLIFGARVIPVFWVGSPWGIFANPWPEVIVATLLFQFVIDQRHKGRWPFRRLASRS
jgi:hypothetical protein